MLRMFVSTSVLAAAGWLLAPAALAGHTGDSLDGLPRPAFARVNDTGEVVIATTGSFPHFVTKVRKETRVREVIVDGQKRTEQYEVEVPYTQATTVCMPIVQNWSRGDVRAREVSGKEVPYEELLTRLKQPTPVLFATRDVPPDQLTVFKPETLLLVTPDPKTVAQRAPLPVPAPVPQAGAAAVPAPATPATPAPTIRLASAQNDMLTLRIQVRTRATTTGYQQIVTEGNTQLAPVQIEHATVLQSGQRMPLPAVGVYNVQGEALDAAQVAEALSAERLVLVSSDGGKVDPAYLQIVKPDTLVLAPPTTAPPQPRHHGQLHWPKAPSPPGAPSA